ncbi:hypothetical protein C0995_009350 [Termitomyces sp. Mi166|nr:hypothetical protein C0995_009350 [Termitomyces sp. Mi166\
MSTSSSRSSSPTLTVSSSDSLYIPVHKRRGASSISSFESSRTFSSASSRTFSSGASTSSDSDSAILPPATPAFIYSRDTLLNLANSPLSRMPQPQRDSLRREVPEVMTNRKQRKAIEHFNHINTVQAIAALRVPSHTRSSYSNGYRQRHDEELTPRSVAV